MPVAHQEDPGASQERDQENPKHTEGHQRPERKADKEQWFRFSPKNSRMQNSIIPLYSGPGGAVVVVFS